jgi:hypothetical protein
MSGNRSRNGTAAAVIVIVLSLFLFAWLTVEVSYPTFEFLSDLLPRRLIPLESFDDIALLVSRFLWDNRSLDLMSQAFVIVAAIICCLALLKPEEGGG